MLLVLIVTLCVVAVAALLCLPGCPLRLYSRIGRVRADAFAALVAGTPAFDRRMLQSLEAALEDLGEPNADAPGRLGPGRSAAAKEQPHAGVLGDAAVPAALAGAVGIDQWLNPDPHVLQAVAQATHDEVRNSLDLWREVQTHHYHLWSESSLYNWRGHVGEQEVVDQLHPWLGGDVQLEPLSNHPASDLSIHGHDYNIKVTGDYANLGPEHFAQYPDTAIIINTDAAHIPADAIHVDLSQPFDPSILDGHAVVVADGLHLSGIEASLGDTFGDVVGGHLDAADVLSTLQDAGIPVLGSAIRVVRSGIRENRLRGSTGTAAGCSRTSRLT